MLGYINRTPMKKYGMNDSTIGKAGSLTVLELNDMHGLSPRNSRRISDAHLPTLHEVSEG